MHITNDHLTKSVSLETYHRFLNPNSRHFKQKRIFKKQGTLSKVLSVVPKKASLVSDLLYVLVSSGVGYRIFDSKHMKSFLKNYDPKNYSSSNDRKWASAEIHGSFAGIKWRMTESLSGINGMFHD